MFSNWSSSIDTVSLAVSSRRWICNNVYQKYWYWLTAWNNFPRTGNSQKTGNKLKSTSVSPAHPWRVFTESELFFFKDFYDLQQHLVFIASSWEFIFLLRDPMEKGANWIRNGPLMVMLLRWERVSFAHNYRVHFRGECEMRNMSHSN